MDASVGFAVLFIGLMMFLTVAPAEINYKEFDFANEIRSYFNNKLDSIDVRSSSIGYYINECFYDENLMCNLNNELDQQILILYAKEETFPDIKGNASKLSGLILGTIFKNQFINATNGSISILECINPPITEPKVLYTNADSEVEDPLSQYSEIASTRWIVSASENNKNYGPCVFEVQVWK
jgi:hypothetical protein